MLNQKGGVGKTTLAVNLAAVVYDVLVRPGPIFREVAEQAPHGDPQSPVLVVSTDPQASSVWWSRRAERGRGVPFDYAQIDSPGDLQKLRDAPYQHVFVDTAGSLVEEDKLQVAVEVATDVVVPIVPEPLAFDPTSRTIEAMLALRDVPYRLVLNGWDPRDGEGVARDTAKYSIRRGWPIAKVVVRSYRVHTNAAAEGMVVTQYPKNRTSVEARADFDQLALELGYGGRPSGGRGSVDNGHA